MTLQEIFNEIGNLTAEDQGGSDKGNPHIHTYLEIYDKLFTPFRNGCHIMEIGLATGNSIELWDRYFENSKITGVDISVVFDYAGRNDSGNTIRIFQHDATKDSFLETIKEEAFDIVIDDGDHLTDSQLRTFKMIEPQMKPGSIYIIEDLLALDIERERYLALHPNAEIIDLRANGRFDNALVVIKFD